VDMRNQNIRVNIANSEILKTRRAAITKFMEVYAKSIDWAYSNPQAIEIFAKNMKVPVAVAKQGVDEFYPKSAMQMGEIRDLERTLKEALESKFIPSAKTPKDVEGMIDIVYKPK